MKKLLLLLPFFLFYHVSQAQIIIPLLFGDKLNQNENIDFGIQGGLNLSSVGGLDGSRPIVKPNLGIYFDFLMKDSPWSIHTGFFALSTMGAGNLPVYSTNNAELDKLMVGGEVKRVFNYFSLPLLAKYNFKNAIYVEGGPQLGLMYGATDKFSNKLFAEHDLHFKNDVGSLYRNFDMGLTFGVGYIIPRGSGVNLSLRYYLGLMNISKEGPSQYNRSCYLVVGFPVGGKSK